MVYGGLTGSCFLQRGARRSGIDFYDTTLMPSSVAAKEFVATKHPTMGSTRSSSSSSC